MKSPWKTANFYLAFNIYEWLVSWGLKFDFCYRNVQKRQNSDSMYKHKNVHQRRTFMQNTIYSVLAFVVIKGPKSVYKACSHLESTRSFLNSHSKLKSYQMKVTRQTTPLENSLFLRILYCNISDEKCQHIDLRLLQLN